MIEIAFFISLFAITQRKPHTSGFRALNWALIADSIAIIVVGSIVWYYTLEERAEYQEVWLQQTTSIRIQLQDKVCSMHFFPLVLAVDDIPKDSCSLISCSFHAVDTSMVQTSPWVVTSVTRMSLRRVSLAVWMLSLVLLTTH